jgi:hypothetical protein
LALTFFAVKDIVRCRRRRFVDWTRRPAVEFPKIGTIAAQEIRARPRPLSLQDKTADGKLKIRYLQDEEDNESEENKDVNEMPSQYPNNADEAEECLRMAASAGRANCLETVDVEKKSGTRRGT